MLLVSLDGLGARDTAAWGAGATWHSRLRVDKAHRAGLRAFRADMAGAAPKQCLCFTGSPQKIDL
ncbi:hypothetical protein BFP70_16685 [Thioclava sp. SK-1]|nr:hypothetical protein BFP70_16685 [Thioclava sp. SK-1]